MHLDALQTLKAGLSGTATTKLLDVLEAAFGVAEAEKEVPNIQPTPVEAEEVLPSSAFVPKAADTWINQAHLGSNVKPRQTFQVLLSVKVLNHQNLGL